MWYKAQVQNQSYWVQASSDLQVHRKLNRKSYEVTITDWTVHKPTDEDLRVERITNEHAKQWNIHVSKLRTLEKNVRQAVKDGVENYDDFKKWLSAEDPFSMKEAD